MKIKYLLLIPVLVLSLFCGGETVKAETIDEKPLFSAEKSMYSQVVGRSYKIPRLIDGKMSATKYFVYDLNANRFLILHGEKTDRIYPASITKLFTAYVALRYIDPEQTLTVGAERDLIDPDSSVAGLEQGDRITVRQLVASMMLPSGNDATYTLTTAVGRLLRADPNLPPEEAIRAFVQMMNVQGTILGLKDSHFVTPDGIHDTRHYISLEDMVTVARLAMNDPVISEYVRTRELTIPLRGGRELELRNTNQLLQEDSGFYCPYVVGLKTGYTEVAGNCLLTQCRIGEQDLLVGIFGCEDGPARYVQTILMICQASGVKLEGVEL